MHPRSRGNARAAEYAATLLALCACSGLVACRAERHLVFETDPPGAQVRIDEKLVGVTPLDLRFDDYGDRRVTLYRAGYRSHSTVLEVGAPWYSYFPLDLISEVLLPFGWEDIHRLQVELEPQEGTVAAPDLDAVLRRAEALRRAGPEGPAPLPPEPAKPTAIEE